MKTDKSLTKAQQWARDNYTPGAEIDELWHPDIVVECRVMNAEVDAKRKKDRKKIREVVESVDDATAQFEGNIVLMVGFDGGVTKMQKLRPDERKLVTEKLPPEIAKQIGLNKPLIGEFKELDELEGWKAEMRERFKRFGVPFIGDGMTVLSINTIPDVEVLADEVDAKLPELVEKMLAAYPEKIKKENVPIPELHNTLDYATVESLRAKFKWRRKWMHFGVPEVLKEIDMARYEAERKRTASVWAEVKKNGIILLRKQLAEMTERLVESVTPDTDGKKKRFYETTVTNMTEFFEQFDRRNISGDTELAEVVADLKKLVSNKDTEQFKTDETLRAKVTSSGAAIAKQLQTMIMDAESRVITFED